MPQVGAGVLGLPLAVAYLTWAGGMVIMTVSWIVTLYTLWQLCSMHEINGKRFNRYHELGQVKSQFVPEIVFFQCAVFETYARD